MNKLKMILAMVVAIFCFSAADAQTSKMKNKTKKQKTAMHYQCPMKCEGDKTYVKAGKCPVCNMQLKAIKTSDAHPVAYQCSMKCEGDKTYSKAGKCPVCNMDMTKMEVKKTVDMHVGHNHL